MPDNGIPRAEGKVDQLVRVRFFAGAPPGVFVEVGAAHPEYLSVSALYRELGWKVVAIEPNPEFCALHRAQGHEVLQYACGEHDEDGVEFSVVDSGGAAYAGGNVSYESFSSLGFKADYASLLRPALTVRKIEVKLRRLDTLMQDHAPTIDRIDILAIDVEGWEVEVLNGLDMQRFRPSVVILENLFDAGSYRTYMRAHGYVLWRRIAPNDVYVRPWELRFDERMRSGLGVLVRRGPRLIGALRGRL